MQHSIAREHRKMKRESRLTSPSVYCLHLEDWDRFDERIETLRSSVDYIAIGMDLHMQYPRQSIDNIKNRGLRAYAHFLYYDIEEVVVQAAKGLVDLGYDAFDIHAFCGDATISRTCAIVREHAELKGKVAPLMIACALLPTQLDLPWRSNPNDGDPGEIASLRAKGAAKAGADGVLVPYQVASNAAAVVPSNKVLISYADPGETGVPASGCGRFYDWHLDALWATSKGIDIIRSRRS